ncbi:MAG TPA: MFS transporter [Nitrososphaeraceae archaeon]|nr:MFS transporter [Nitrososphaeraceae archaeon]
MTVSLISLIVMMGATMVTPSLTLYAKEGFSDNGFIIGAIVAGYAIGRVITDIPSGFLTDRIGISKTMKIGLVIQILSSILAGIAPNYWILFLMRVTEGIGSSIYVNAAVTYVLLSNQSSRRGTVMGMYQSIMMTGITIGPIFGAFIANTYGLNASYFAYAAVLVVAMIIVFFIQHKGKFHIITNGVDNTYNLDFESFGIIRNISIYINSASLATFGFAFLRSGIYTMAIPLFAYENLHLSVISVGFIFTSASVANLLASFFSGKLTDRYGMKWPLIISILVASFIIIIIPFTTLMIQILILVIILGITSGFFGQSVAWAAEKVEEKVKRSINRNKNSNHLHTSSFVTKGIGFNRMIGDAGLILGPLIVGYIIVIMKNQNFVWMVSFVTVSVVLMSICSLLTKANNSRNMIFTKV